MRHMRSRRILAMLLALSMIFGLLTTTAFAGEVDQNTSNVGESAANGTSESGSGEGQSSGASEDESSKVTNKEDVPAEEETIPEEKKTTSDEEVDTQVGEEPTPVETQLTNYVMVGGIAGFADTKFASFEAAYEAIQPEISKLAASDELGQGGATSAAAFKEFFTDVDNSGNATLTYTITGNVPYDETNHSHLLTMGRRSSHYNADSELLHLINFKFVGANSDRTDTLTINSDITLPYEWWGENTTTSISFEGLTITGSAPNGLYPYQAYFDGINFTVDNCTLKGIKIYNCANVGGSYTITNSTLDGTGAAKDAYAIHLQGNETAPLTITISGNEIFGYDRGINIDQKTANATISGNAISVNDSGRSCIQLTQLATTEIKGNTLALTGGNALTLHNNLLKLSTAPEISITGNTISGTGYLIYDDAAANNSAFTADTLKLTYGTNTVDNTVDMTQGVKGSTVVASSDAVKTAVEGTTSNAVAKVGNETFDTLEKAFAALNSTNYTLELLDENAWTGENVYWAAGAQSGYEATLAEALTAAYKANADYITIICRPGADVGTMTHGHVADDITIYGNNAYVSGGECDLEVDTFKFDRSTGRQATDGVTLDKDITITAYELDNLGVWGQRNTNNTVNVNLTDCDTVHGITVQRVYISGTTGMNNITLSGCDFVTKATSVYSNADGEINITDCSFTGAQVPVNFNHKADGAQTVTVTNSTFTSCGDNGDWKQFAAPVRFVNSGSGSQTATVDTCTFAGTVGTNGDILIGDGRTGEKSNDVSLTVTNTEATVMAQKPGYYTSDGTTDDTLKGKKTLTASESLTVSTMDDLIGGSTETTNVAKVGETEYETLAQAIAEAGENSTVTLLKDTTEDVEITKNITLDLGGKTLTNTGAGKATITITKDATATVKNGSVVGGTSYYNIQNNGTATFEGLTATAGNNGSSMVDNWGTLTIESGTYTGGLDTIKNEPNAKLTVNDGTFTLTKGNSKGYTAVIFNYGDLKINNGMFIQSDTNAPYGQAQVIHTDKDKDGSSVPSTLITGGTFKNLCTRSTAWTVRATNAAAGATKVSGGSFNTKVQETYCADGFIPTKNADGTYGVKEGKYVASVGSKNYETLADAIRLAAKGKTVKLLDDVTASVTIAETKNLTLDLNGFTLTNTEGSHTIVNNGTLTIMDSSAAKSGTVDNVTHARAAIVNYGTMTLAGGTYTRSLENPENNKDSGGGNSFYTILNDKGGSLTIKDGVTVTNVGHFSSMICNGNDAVEDTTLTIEGGLFSGGINTIKNGEFGKLTINGGSFTNATQCVVMNWNEASITGGTFELASGVNSTLLFSVAWSDHAIGKMTISGGTFKYTETQGLVQDTYDSGKYTGTLAVSGGTFSNAVLPKYCADGYVPTKNEDGTYGVKVDDSVAEVGGVKYLSLQAAIDAAKYHETVTLLSDTRENVTVTGKSKVITLDLAGHILNGGTVANTPALTVSSRANLTIVDSSAAQTGTIMREDTAANSGVSSHYVIDIQDTGSQLTFKSGNVKNNSGNADMSKGASLIRIGNDNTTAKPQMFITGGTFTQDNFIAIKVDRGTLTMNGGEINSQNTYAVENWYHTTINDGTINGKVSSWVWSGGNNKDNNLSINGGTIHGDIESVTYDGTETKTAKITINGGVIDGKLLTRDYNKGDITDATKATIGVVAGNFRDDPTKFLVEGSTVSKNDEGRYDAVKAYLCKIGEKSYYTMDEALKAVKSGETIVLLRDCSTNKQATSGTKDFTIDLAEFTWNHTGSSEIYSAFEANNENGKITVKNGNVVSNQPIGLVSWDNAGLVFDTVKMTTTGRSGIETNGNNTNDTVTLKDSTLNVPNGFGIYFPSSGTLTIENSKITAKTMGVQVCSGSLDIKGQNTAITVSEGPVPKTENDGAIQDGAAISIVNRAGYKGLEKITVTGGTFKAKSGNAAVKAYDWSNKEPGEANFTASDKVAISGGTYSTPVAENLCAEGFVPVTNGDGTYGVQPDGNVAEIGSVKYASLDEALKAAKDRETVKLLKDVEATQVLVTKGTLDLNGKTLKVSYFMSFSDVIDSTEGNGLIETGVQSFFTTNNSYLPLRDSAANGYRLFSYKLNKLGVVEGSSTAFWFNIIFGGEKAYSLLNTAGHNADLFIPMQIGSGNEWQYIKMNQSTLTKWTTPILNGTAPSKCGYYVNITGLDTLTSGTVLTLKTSIRSCGVEKLSDDSLTYTVK